jgi:hypothetical protein
MECDDPSNVKYLKKICRCPRCKKAHNEYEKRRAKLRRKQPSDFIPADETIKHLVWLTSQGFSLRMMERLTGISRPALQRIRAGVNIRVSRWTAEKILAVNTTKHSPTKGYRHPYTIKGSYLVYKEKK